MTRTAITCVATSLILSATGCDKKQPDEAPADTALICHVGGTMNPVMNELAKIYKEKTGRDVEINTAGSGELMAYIEGQEKGDVYVCHDPFMDILMLKNEMGIDAWTVAELVPVIVVQKGNPKKVAGLQDLTKPELSVVLTHYEHSTLGRMLPTIFSKIDVDFKGLNEKKKFEIHRKGGMAANIVKMKNADAAMVWNAVAALRLDSLDVVELPAEHLPVPGVDTITSATGKDYKLRPVRVTVASLKCSKRPDDAAKFAEFIASEEASRVFEKFGFASTTPIKEYVNGEPTEHARSLLPKGAVK